jgi:UDP-GlcNAc:undecaprenyl-phosphate/decaprenyl-phosphate GlcNAc-1-phosphate transferase
LIATLLTAAAVALVLTWPVRTLALKLGAVAYPGGRHVHEKITPTAGGLAIFAAFWVAVLVHRWPPQDPLLGILLGSAALAIVCLMDDIKGLSPGLRLVAQILVAYVVCRHGVRIEGITHPTSLLGHYHYFSLGVWATPLTILWIVAITNAINWLDGLDGLVAGVAAMAGLTVMVGVWGGSVPLAGLMAAALSGACLGFLPHNFNPAKIFMGDTGSMFLGYILACISIMGPFKSATAIAVLVPLLVLGVPIFDTAAAIVRRLAAGRSPFSADRGHIHHRLMDRGLSMRQSVLIIYGLTAILCGAALTLWRLS